MMRSDSTVFPLPSIRSESLLWTSPDTHGIRKMSQVWEIPTNRPSSFSGCVLDGDQVAVRVIRGDVGVESGHDPVGGHGSGVSPLDVKSRNIPGLSPPPAAVRVVFRLPALSSPLKAERRSRR